MSLVTGCGGTGKADGGVVPGDTGAVRDDSGAIDTEAYKGSLDMGEATDGHPTTVALVRLTEWEEFAELAVGEVLVAEEVEGEFRLELPETPPEAHLQDIVLADTIGIGAVYAPMVFEDNDGDGVHGEGESVLGTGIDAWLVWTEASGWQLLHADSLEQRALDAVTLTLRGIAVDRLRYTADANVESGFTLGDHGIVATSDGQVGADVLYDVLLTIEQQPVDVLLALEGQNASTDEVGLTFALADHWMYLDGDGDGAYTRGEPIPYVAICVDEHRIKLVLRSTPMTLAQASWLDLHAWQSGWQMVYDEDGQLIGLDSSQRERVVAGCSR
jgi:hypothetical protein